MHKYGIMLLLLLCASISLAQHKLSGQVVDARSKEPAAFATIAELGTTNGTLADENGQFSLSLSSDTATIEIRLINYEVKILTLNGQNYLEIALSDRSAELDEVVITALGISREKQSLGYSVQELQVNDLTQVREPNLVNAFAGRVAGVQTTNGATGIGSSSRIVIRGESSLSGRNQPLFVVDGVPISNELVSNNTENTESGFQEVDYGNGAAELSPDDIASITVLKGPGAAALYGTRAAHGVIVIKTKEGRKDGLGVSFHSSITFEQPLVMPQYQNQYGNGSGGLYSYEDGLGGGVNDGGITSFGPQLNGQLINQFNSPSTAPNGNPLRAGDVIARQGQAISPTPWEARPDNVRDFFETGITYTNNLALSGGNEQSQFRLSFSRLDNEGILPNTDLSRNGIAFSGSHKLSQKLSARIFANYIGSESGNRPGIGYGSENPMYIFSWMGRQTDVEALRDYWQAGQEGFQQFNFNYQWMDNPYLTLLENTNAFNKDRLLGNASILYELSQKWSFRLRGGLDGYNDLRKAQRAFSSQRWKQGAYREDNILFREDNVDALLSFQDSLGKDWGIELSAGANRMAQSLQYKSTVAGQLSVPGIYSFENSAIPLVITQEVLEKQIHSVYCIAQASFRGWIFGELSIRNDWSSTLPASNRSFAYYSASASVVFSEKLKLPKWITYGKLRLSTASVGNDTDPYQLNNTFAFRQNYGANPLLSGNSTLLNTGLKPERINALELGAELWFLNDRLQLDAAVYQNNSKNQIISLPTSAASGYTERVVNGGEIQSQGIELSLKVRVIDKKKLQWNLLANFSTNRSEVLFLPNGAEQYVTGFSRVYSSSQNTVFYIAKPGGEVGDMYGTGFKKVDGQVVYDANGIPVRDGELRYLGNYNPDFIMGFGSELKLGGLSFGFLLDWRQGGTIVSRTLAIGSTSGVLEHTLEGRESGVVGEGVTNVGTDESPQYVPNATAVDAGTYYNQFYNRANEESALYDASYLKLRQISLYYTLPSKWIAKTGLSKVELGVIASNLFVITENPHFDPELSTMQGRTFTYGVEDMSYPSSRSLGFSLRARL